MPQLQLPQAIYLSISVAIAISMSLSIWNCIPSIFISQADTRYRVDRVARGISICIIYAITKQMRKQIEAQQSWTHTHTNIKKYRNHIHFFSIFCWKSWKKKHSKLNVKNFYIMCCQESTKSSNKLTQILLIIMTAAGDENNKVMIAFMESMGPADAL